MEHRCPSCDRNIIYPEDHTKECPNQNFGHGVSVLAAMTGMVPKPNHMLKWNDDIPPAVSAAMRNGETALLHDAEGRPFKVILRDYYGTIREVGLSTVKEFREESASNEQKTQEENGDGSPIV